MSGFLSLPATVYSLTCNKPDYCFYFLVTSAAKNAAITYDEGSKISKPAYL